MRLRQITLADTKPVRAALGSRWDPIPAKPGTPSRVTTYRRSPTGPATAAPEAAPQAASPGPAQ